jgi:release factor glutamine methyltransferase
MSAPPTMIGRVIAAGADYLGKAGVEEPDLVVEHLLSRLLDCGRLDLRTRLDQPLDERRTEAMRRALRRAAAGEPVQYILGLWPFRDHTFRVDRRALIPRPETEVLVQVVLDCAALWAEAAPTIADVGTGTGCIAISLALARPGAAFVALDVSEDALSLARENANALGVSGRIAFAAGELPDVVEPESLSAVVSNPPYIASAEVDRLPRHIREHEPRQALDGGTDGLDVLRAVATDAAMALRAGGFLFLEMGADQAAAVRGILSDNGFADIAILPDLAGHDRIARAQLP